MTTAPSATHDFVSLYERYRKLAKGQQADIRRAPDPDDLRLVRATYQLLPDGQRPTPPWLRVIYFLPHAGHKDEGPSLGQAIAAKNVREARLIQLVRTEPPNDIVQLRRLLIQLGAEVDWQKLGWALLRWDDTTKRRIVEDYFMALPKQ